MECRKVQLMCHFHRITGARIPMVHAFTNTIPLLVPRFPVDQVWPPWVCGALPRPHGVNDARFVLQEYARLHVVITQLMLR